MLRARAVILMVALLGGVGFGGYRALEARSERAAADVEAARQRAERQTCRAYLREIYQAVAVYRRLHHGQLPPSCEALIPRYLSDPKHLLCPTADRWSARGRPLSAGQIIARRRVYPVSYGLRWLAAGFRPASAGRPQDLVICDAHREGMYRAVYDRPIPLGAFDEPQRERLSAPVRSAPVLKVHADGKLDEAADAAF
jgi:hypothetical protein